jgi:hypothetical protein
MNNVRFRPLLLLLAIATLSSATSPAQSFGGAFQRKKIVLVRKLPPTGHIDGPTFAVKVTGAGIPPDVAATLQSTLESDIVSNDPRLRSVTDKDKPDAIVNVQITTYVQPAAVVAQQAGINFGGFGKKGGPLQNEPVTHVTGSISANFNAQDIRDSRSIAANTVTAKYDQQFAVQPAQPKPSLGSLLSAHIPKMPGSAPGGGSEEADKPPTPAELKDALVQTVALEIASHLVNTSEQVDVDLARGPGLDDADRLMDQKLWTRALEQLETMPPFATPEDDAYRLYDLGVVNEALGYDAEDVTKAKKYLEEASIDYGKAIDAKQAEKGFLAPQTRIDTALAHYKVLGDQAAANAAAANAAASASAASAAGGDTLTNADVISMVSAKLDEANIIDTIQHSSSVKFDLSAKGQVDLAKNGVKGTIITAMKQRSRGQQ